MARNGGQRTGRYAKIDDHLADKPKFDYFFRGLPIEPSEGFAMSSNYNPYQVPLASPPQFPSHGGPPVATIEGGLWRQGNLLVMDKRAPLPPRCVKSNVPTQRTLKRSLSWHHPMIFISILAGLLIYVILALVLRKTATIYIGLSDEWFAKRRMAIFVGWTTVLASIGMFVAALALSDRTNNLIILLPISVLVFLIGAFYGLIGSRMVSPKKITETHVWLKGVHPDFLAELPELQS
ncbi:MAG: hypothetical protein Q8M16_10320 [Pirellulaceae bacterium]|nr:hypothetical protein [Pirellulaceae bacterium]